ncbi:MAG: hypothetical protein ACXAEU_19710 [Candidatus Hodarchaeales archaeon]|jgi:hypothetical protein
MSLSTIFLKTIAAFTVAVLINIVILVSFPGNNLLAFLLGLGIIFIFLSPWSVDVGKIHHQSSKGRELSERSTDDPLTYQEIVNDLKIGDTDLNPSVKNLQNFSDIFATMAQDASRGTYYTEITGFGKRQFGSDEDNNNVTLKSVSSPETLPNQKKDSEKQEDNVIDKAGFKVKLDNDQFYSDKDHDGLHVKLKIDPDGKQHYIFEDDSLIKENPGSYFLKTTPLDEFEDFVFTIACPDIERQMEEYDEPSLVDPSVTAIFENKKDSLITRLESLQLLTGFKLNYLSSKYGTIPVLPAQNVLIHLNNLENTVAIIESNDEILLVEELLDSLEKLLIEHMLNNRGILSTEFFSNTPSADDLLDEYQIFQPNIDNDENLILINCIKKLDEDLVLIEEHSKYEWLRELLKIVEKPVSSKKFNTEVNKSIILEIVSILIDWVVFIKKDLVKDVHVKENEEKNEELGE